MEETTTKCPECGRVDKNIEDDERTIKCSVCNAVIEDVILLSPRTVARFYKWTVASNDINGESDESFYCPKHSGRRNCGLRKKVR